MKKMILSLILIGIMLISLTGCAKRKTYTYQVDTGDKISIQINTQGGYELTQDLPFVIKKANKTLSTGTFISASYYSEYINSVRNDPASKIIVEDDNNKIEYVFYAYNNTEFNYVIKIKNSNTLILLTNPNSQKEAEDCFKLLNISLTE